jgi:hypothetical protein
VPDLDRIDAVPVGPFAFGKQEQDCGGSGPAFDQPRVTKSFTIVTALRVRLESSAWIILAAVGIRMRR